MGRSSLAMVCMSPIPSVTLSSPAWPSLTLFLSSLTFSLCVSYPVHIQELRTEESRTMASKSARHFPVIKAVRAFVVGDVGSGGDYHNVRGGHWSVILESSRGLRLTQEGS